MHPNIGLQQVIARLACFFLLCSSTGSPTSHLLHSLHNILLYKKFKDIAKSTTIVAWQHGSMTFTVECRQRDTLKKYTVLSSWKFTNMFSNSFIHTAVCKNHTHDAIIWTYELWLLIKHKDIDQLNRGIVQPFPKLVVHCQWIMLDYVDCPLKTAYDKVNGLDINLEPLHFKKKLKVIINTVCNNCRFCEDTYQLSSHHQLQYDPNNAGHH